jgi:hypothetical protein
VTEENRPYSQTDWERSVDAEQHRTVEELIETSRQIAAESTAVSTLTREAVIADNKKFRRRNTVLLTLISLLLIFELVEGVREFFVVGPQRDDIEEIAKTLEECTTPGPHAATEDDPTTGHECFDEGQERTASAVADIVDANGNGELDSQEILDFLKKFEVFLEFADEVPES